MIRRLLWLPLGVLAVLAVLLLPAPAKAASNGWSPTLLLTTKEQILSPAMTVDSLGRLYAFWTITHFATASDKSTTQELEFAERANNVWSKPFGIYVAPSINAPTAALDQFGTIHVFWQAGAGMLYAGSVPARVAAIPENWSPLTPVDYANQSSAVVSDNRGALDLVYPGPSSRGVLFSRSVDGGHTWSFPVTVSPAESGSAANFTRLAVGPDGTIHVVWTEFQLPNGWPPTGLYYSHSLDEGKTWSTPVQVAGAGFSQANVLAGPNGLVHVAWNGQSGVVGRYDRWSTDNGKSWSKPAILLVPLTGPVDVGGSTGPPGLVMDSSGGVHLLFEEGNRVWHSEWKSGHWGNPEYVPSGDETGLPPPTEGIATNVRHIEQPVLAITRGNELTAIFWDERPGINRLWAVTKRLDTPTTPVQGFAVPTATPIPTPSPSPTPVDPINPRDSGMLPASSVPMDSRLLTFIWLVPILGLFAGIIGIRYWLVNR